MGKKKQEKVLETLTLTFKLSHLWEHFLDAYFKNSHVTIKQFLLLLTIRDEFDKHPAISEIAAATESSHQNIKQIALHLKEKSLITINSDPTDKRISRIALTNAGENFINEHLGELIKMFTKIFKKEKIKDIRKLNKLLEDLIGESKKRLDKITT
jgi:DNA-binding MarR family transcriptional regulator